MYKHKFVKLTNTKYNFVAEIDENIAPLIKELWKADIDTTYCCQSNPKNWMYIQFLTSMDAADFIQIVTKYEEDPNSMYWRICGFGGPKNSWRYNVRAADFHLFDTLTEDDDLVWVHSEDEAFMEFRTTLWFPKKDYPLVFSRVKEYNKALKKQQAAVKTGE
jgi:hypothetical protein